MHTNHRRPQPADFPYRYQTARDYVATHEAQMCGCRYWPSTFDAPAEMDYQPECEDAFALTGRLTVLIDPPLSADVRDLRDMVAC